MWSRIQPLVGSARLPPQLHRAGVDARPDDLDGVFATDVFEFDGLGDTALAP